MRNYTIAAKVTLISLFSLLASLHLNAQCTIDQPNDKSGCPNQLIVLNATSTSTNVNHHIWYNSNMLPISPTTENKIEYVPGSGQVAWVSTLEIYPSANTVYYVAASCNTAVKKMVTVTVSSGTPIGLGMSPSSNPADLCAGESITLTASNGTNYQWRFNNPNDTNWTGGSTKVATQSGTYYLRGTTSCNAVQDQQITLNFKQPLSGIDITGPSSFCQAASTTQFTTAGSNYDYVTWSITDTDPAATATVNTSGLVTWNNISTNATLTMIAYGCHGTSVTKTKTITVTKSPNQMQINTTQASFCMGGMGGTAFTISGNDYTSLRWESVSGAGNTINKETGFVTWSGSFSGTAVITAKAYGCSNSVVTFTRNFDIYAKPSATVTPASAVIPFGTPSVTLTAGAGSGYSYQWLNNGAAMSGQTAQTFAASNSGSYSVRVINANACASVSPIVPVTLENNYNYIIESVLQSDRKDNGTPILEADVRTLAIQKKLETVKYFDGVARLIQSVTVKASPGGQDVVQPVLFDAYGREVLKYLPIVMGTTGTYKPQIIDTVTNAYVNGAQNTYLPGSNNKIADDTNPYSKTIFEASPLNRVVEEGSVGAAWQPDGTNSYASTDPTRKFAYETNTASEVIRWSYTNPTATYPMGIVYTGAGTTPDYYGLNELFKNKSKDESGNETIEYKDKSGKVVLKSVQVSSTIRAKTYYIYNDLDNLVCVISPEGSTRLAADFYQAGATDATRNSFLERWAFRYVYDGRKRMALKQVPGAKPVYMVYDNRNRLVLTQDGNQRKNITTSANKMEWTFTKYDLLNRPVLTGIYTHGSFIDQAAMQTYVNTQITAGNKFYEDYDGSATNEGYTNRTFPTTGATLLTVNYYDNYSFRTLWGNSHGYFDQDLSAVANSVTYDQPTTASIRTVGLQTGSRMRVFEGGTLGISWIKTAIYYDDNGRVIQTVADNQKGGMDRTSTLYDFVDRVLKTRTVQTNGTVEWKDQVAVSIYPNKIVSTNSTAAWATSGAASVALLPSGRSGWIETVVREVTSNRMIGFSDVNSNTDYTTIDYAIYLDQAAFKIYENGTLKSTITPNLGVGDVLRIERAGTVVRYKRNGTVVYTSAVASSTQLMADVSFHTTGGSLAQVYSSFSPDSTVISRRFEYDPVGRLVRTWHKFDPASEILLSYNEYNELGQLVDKKLHSTNASATDAKQSVDYRYNIRGWLSSVNDASLTLDGTEPKDYFGMELGYNNVLSGLTNTPLFNGNISAMKWSNAQGTGTTKENAYLFTYDTLNRIKTTSFFQKTSGWGASTTFTESGYKYDLNGNIRRLTRSDHRTGLLMDDLTYDYGTGTTGGNRLRKVTDAGDDYTGFIDGVNVTEDYAYDENGNMITDENKGITGTTGITYNYLNLPEVVTRGSNTVRYVYDATGRKLSQVTTFGGVVKQVDYVGELQYENNVLQFVNHEEGRIVLADTKLVYMNAGDVSLGISAVGTTLTTGFAGTNGEKYLKAVATGAAGRKGIHPIGGTLAVTPNTAYKLRVRGYRDKGTAAASSAAYLWCKAGGVDMAWPGGLLPAGGTTAQTESWVEQTIFIPAGVTDLQVGVAWVTAASGEAMYINDVELTKLGSLDAEYQYHLKDHLGNVRVTFTTKVDVDVATATLETINAADEQSKFIYYDEAVKVNAPLFDHTGQTGSDQGIYFYRGINLNGPATVINGNNWVASSTAANFTVTNVGAFDNQSVPLVPATDAARTTMMRSSVFGDVNMTMSNVPNGTYDIYLYVWEDNNPENFYINIEGVQRLSNYYSGTTGQWTKLGPFRTAISDGNINVFASSWVNASGLEVWTVSQALTNQSPVVTAYLDDKSAIEGQAFSYQFPLHTFIDPDAGNTLTYTSTLSSGSALPAWLTFNSGTRTLSGTPTTGSTGFYEVRVTCSDGLGGSVSDVFMITVTPAGTTTFYRAVNLNGPATTIDGNSWQTGISNANFSYTNVTGFENQGVTLVPATDASRATMIRSSLYGNFPSITALNVANGVYDVYLYVWEDNISEIFNVAVEGSLVQTNYSSGAAGAWAKLGPFRTIVGDGNILITTAGGTANLSGLEIRSVSTSTVAPTGISVSPASASVYVGKSVQVSRTITPANATNRSVTWTSSNSSVAMVNNDGWVTGIAPGTATITASLAGFTSQATVTVSKIPSSYSARLNGTPNEKYGLAKSIAVMPGDVITAEVFAKYVDTNTNNWNAVLNNLMATIANSTAPAGTFIDGGAAGSIGGTTFPFIGTLTRTGDSGTGPKAYLNYLVFDKNYVYKSGGFKRLSATPKENGTNVAHERLAFDGAQKITVTEPGYVYIYISNENDTQVDVYFDDFKVTQTKGAIVSSQDYYAFGLQFNSYSRENSTPNQYKFNGKEEQDELNLSTYDYGARMYDPTLGKWWQVDPLSDKYESWSPYAYVMNNPLKFNDPTGMFSTHTDETGQVVAVYNDGDKGVYRHEKNADGGSVTTNQINKRHEKSTSAGGERMGETEHWDEFIAPGKTEGEGQIYFGESQSWDPLIASSNEHANSQDLTVTMEESKHDQPLDIKTNTKWAQDGPMTGRLLDGKYATARSAGNYLAGMNGVTGTVQGKHISGETYMKLAGAYQEGKLSVTNIAKILTTGASFGPAPYYGEQSYSGRMIQKGIEAGYKKLNK